MADPTPNSTASVGMSQSGGSNTQKNRSGIIRFNVGGKLFATTASTLSNRGENYFTSLISGRVPSTMTDDGAFFIDRDPGCFSVILNYLRTGEVRPPKHLNTKLLSTEAEFYCITLPRGSVAGSKHHIQCAILQYEHNAGEGGFERMILTGDIEDALDREFGQRRSCDWKAWLINLQHRGWKLASANLFHKPSEQTEERLFVFTK